LRCFCYISYRFELRENENNKDAEIENQF